MPKNVGFAVFRDAEHNRGIPRASHSGILMSEIKFPGSRRNGGFRVWRCSGPSVRLPSVPRETGDKATEFENRATTVFRVTPERFRPHGTQHEARLRSTKATEQIKHLILFGAAFWFGRMPRTQCPMAASKSFTKVVEMTLLPTWINSNSTG
jgi:hypothetical protein